MIQGPGIADCDEQKKGLVPRVVDGLFETTKVSDGTIKHTIKLSMVLGWPTEQFMLLESYLKSTICKIWTFVLTLTGRDLYGKDKVCTIKISQ